MTDFPVTLFHNPACSTSRKVLAMIRAAGFQPTIVDYLKAGWTRPQLEALLAAMPAHPRDILRAKEPLANELGLTDPSVNGERLLDAMVAHPILVERPIMVTPLGVAVCRPAEAAATLLQSN